MPTIIAVVARGGYVLTHRRVKIVKDGGMKLKIRITNRLIISDPTPAVKAYCEKNLVLDNPDYYKLERMGKYTGNTPKKLYLYEVMGHEIWLPFGCLQDIWKIHPVKEDYSLEICPIERREYESHINLYPYQETAVQAALKGKNGVLVMPPGAGKTQTGLEIIARIGGRALWLTHTQDLLNQSKSRAESVLSQGGYGTITAGKVNIGTHITFATVQTMVKLDLTNFKDMFDVIVVDECHHTATGSPTKVTMFYKVLSSLSARYKIGLTATPKRADGLQAAMFALLGPKLHEVTREEVAHTTCPVKVSAIQTGWMPDYDAVLMGDGMIDYNKVIDAMIHDEKRYDFVLNKLLHLFGPVMVLANRVEYLQRMCRDYVESQAGSAVTLSAVCISGQGQSKKAKAERKAALEALNNGELDCVFASYQLAAEGLDCPNLRYVVFATPEKNDVTVTQATGRVGRKAEGKEYGTVIDFVDDFGLYKGFYKERLKVYKKIGAEVIE
jgi:superfamily II DNA or RNA helicase